MASNWWESSRLADEEDKWWESSAIADAPAREAGGGRGFVNPPLASERQPQRQYVEPARDEPIDYTDAATSMQGTPTESSGEGLISRLGKMLRPEYRSVMEGYQPTPEQVTAERDRRLSYGAGPVRSEVLGAADQVRSGQAKSADPTVNRVAQEMARRNEPGFNDLVERAKDADPDRFQEAARRDSRREFAKENPLLGSLAAGSAGLVSGAANIPSVAADAFNQTFVNPVLQAAGLEPLARVPNAFGTEYLAKAAEDFMPKIGKQEMGTAWNRDEFAPWLMSKLAANSPQIAQSLLAAFVPPLRAVLLPGMAGTAAGQSFAEGDDSRVAVAKGAIEYATEKLPLGVFDKIGDTLKGMSVAKQNTVLAVAGQRLLQSGAAVTANTLTNAIEETTAQFGGNVLDKYFQGKDIELSKGLAEAAVVGGVTGKLMSAPQAAAAATGYYEPENQIAREINRGVDSTQFITPADQIARDRLSPYSSAPTRIEVDLPPPPTIEGITTATSVDQAADEAVKYASSVDSFAQLNQLTAGPSLGLGTLPGQVAGMEPAIPSVGNLLGPTAAPVAAPAPQVAALLSPTPPAPAPGLVAEIDPQVEQQFGLDKLRLDMGVPKGITAPRPQRIQGTPVAQMTDEQLDQIASNETVPAITRRGASVELAARRAEAGTMPQEATTNVQSTQLPAVADAAGAQPAPAAGGSFRVEGRVDPTFVSIPDGAGMRDLPAAPVGGAAAAQRAREAAQRSVETWSQRTGSPMPAVFNPAPPELDAAVNEVAQAINSQFAGRVYAYNDPRPEAVNGLAIGKTAFVNTANVDVNVARTSLHEFKHTVEQIANAERSAGLADTPAQKFVAQIDSIYDDMTEEGKRSYLTNFLAKDELAAIADPAARETRLQELMAAPETRSEMTADFLGNRATDKKFWQDVAQADPVGFKGFVEKWVGIIDGLLAQLRGTKTQGRKESARVDQYVRDLNKAKMVAREALIAYSQSTRQQTTESTQPGQMPLLSERQPGSPVPVVRIDPGKKKIDERFPQLMAAAEKVAAGEMTPAEYGQMANSPEYLGSIAPYDFVPAPATDDEALNALTANKRPAWNGTNNLQAGERVGLRLDIPAYKDHGVWVNSIHPEGKPTTYSAVSAITDAVFPDAGSKALGVAQGKAKAPFARIEGRWSPITSDKAVARMQEVFDDPQWTQVGYNPLRHSYFFDRKTGNPVTAAEEVIQIGPLVLAKNATIEDADAVNEDGTRKFMFSRREAAAPGSIRSSQQDSDAIEGATNESEADSAAQADSSGQGVRLDDSAAAQDGRAQGGVTANDARGRLQDEARRAGLVRSRADVESFEFDGIAFSLRRIEEINDVPEITMQDLVDETVFPILADLTAAGYIYMGKELRGGPFYTLLPSNSAKGLIWANDAKGVSSIKEKKAARGVIGLVVAMKQDSHATNNTISNIIFRAVEDAIQRGDVAKRDIPKLDKMVRGLASRTATKKRKVDGREVSEKVAVFPRFAEFPGFSDRAASEKFLREMPFEARGLFFEEMSKGPVEDMGLGAVRKVIQETVEPELRGLNMGDVVLAIRFTPGEPAVELGPKTDTPLHDSYRYAVKGEVIGKFKRPISFRNVWVDLINERAASGETNITRDYRSLTLRKPEQLITQEIADRVSGEAYRNISSPAEAQAAVAAANNNWTAIDRPAAAGVKEFLRTSRVFAEGKAVPSYDEAKKRIKDGRLKIFRLAETENWFSIEKRGNRQVMTSIMVAQPGVRNETLLGDMIDLAKKSGATHIEIGGTVAPMDKVAAPRRVDPIIEELSAMTDNDLVNLGIDPAEVRRLNSVLEEDDAAQVSPTSVMAFSKRQDSPADRIKWRKVSDVKESIRLDKLPEHILPFANFMQTMADKAANGGLTSRDVIKAYTIARSSMNRGAVTTDKVRAAGLKLPPGFADAKIRPEGAFGYWLLSPQGQRYLNGAEVAIVDDEAIADAVKVMAPFGTQNALGEDLRRAAGGDLHTRLPAMSAAIAKAAEGKNAVKDWQEATDNLYGVREAKKGFLGSLLGFGQLPTFDARQINVNVREDSKEDTLRALSSKRAREVVAKLSRRMDALSLTMDSEYTPFYRHLVHHAVWDAVGGTATTHEDVIESMLMASKRQEEPAAEPTTSSRRAENIPREELAGRRVSLPVLIEETGQTATITLDAKDALDDVDERESAMQRLLECLRK